MSWLSRWQQVWLNDLLRGVGRGEAGQMQEAGSGEDFAGWLYYVFFILVLLQGWCDRAAIALLPLFCEVFSESASRAPGEGGGAVGAP